MLFVKTQIIGVLKFGMLWSS